jgi:hypothetical protein
VVRTHTRSGLGRRIVWYMVMNVLEEHSESIFTALEKTDEYALTETMVPTNLITWIVTQKTIIMNLNILHFSCIV